MNPAHEHSFEIIFVQVAIVCCAYYHLRTTNFYVADKRNDALQPPNMEINSSFVTFLHLVPLAAALCLVTQVGKSVA